MRFLIDNNLSPLLAERLKAAGHDVMHVRDIGLQASADSVVLERARAENGCSSRLTRTSAACSPARILKVLPLC
jgi:predicted nuclease of predicted toxin-antitoxin system